MPMGVWSSGKQWSDQACINAEAQVQNPPSGCGQGQVQVLGDFDGIDMPLIVRKLSQRDSTRRISQETKKTKKTF
jgi:hypothetical protein